MSATVHKVLIVGGGIGGLSSGIALRQAGIEVEIAEINAQFKVYGVGIIQPSNALRALDALGCADECIRRGSPYGAVNMCTSSGHQFAAIGPPPLGRFPPHNGISRRILHDVLYEAALSNGVNFRMGLTVQTIHNSANAVNVEFTDGSRGTYDLLIGADGVNSLVRKLIFDADVKPQYTGQSVWRYAFPRPAELETGSIFFGKNTKVGLIPMTADTMYMFVVSAEGNDNPFIPEAELVQRMKAHLTEYTTPMVLSLVDQITNPKGIIYRPLETLLMPGPWYKERVLIIGDAAHATIPQLGQGAGLALEDSVVLGELLQSGAEVSEVLAQFMQRRYERCKMVVDVSKQVGEWEQMEWKGIPLPEGANIGALMGRTLGALGAPI